MQDPELPGVKPAPQTSAPPSALKHQLEDGEPLRVGVMGHLAGPPRVLDPEHLGGPVQLQLLLHQRIPRHPQAWPCLALWTIDGPRALERAHLHAHAWPQGTCLLIVGRGIEASHHAGAPCWRLLEVLHAHELCESAAAAPSEPPAPDFFTPDTGAAAPC